MSWAEVSRINSNLEIPLDVLLCLQDYQLLGKYSFVHHNKDILHKMYNCIPASMYSEKVAPGAFVFIVNENKKVGEALHAAFDMFTIENGEFEEFGIENASDLKDSRNVLPSLKTLEEIFENEEAIKFIFKYINLKAVTNFFNVPLSYQYFHDVVEKYSRYSISAGNKFKGVNGDNGLFLEKALRNENVLSYIVKNTEILDKLFKKTRYGGNGLNDLDKGYEYYVVRSPKALKKFASTESTREKLFAYLAYRTTFDNSNFTSVLYYYLYEMRRENSGYIKLVKEGTEITGNFIILCHGYFGQKAYSNISNEAIYGSRPTKYTITYANGDKETQRSDIGSSKHYEDQGYRLKKFPYIAKKVEVQQGERGILVYDLDAED